MLPPSGARPMARCSGESGTLPPFRPWLQGVRHGLGVPQPQLARQEVVRRLADGLKVYDVKVWLDEVELAIGQPLATRLRDAIETADYLVVVLSLHAVASHWVCEEMQIAYALERELGRSIVRPVLIENLDDRTLDELPCQRPLASFRVRSAHSPSEPEHRARPDARSASPRRIAPQPGRRAAAGHRCALRACSPAHRSQAPVRMLDRGGAASIDKYGEVSEHAPQQSTQMDQ